MLPCLFTRLHSGTETSLRQDAHAHSDELKQLLCHRRLSDLLSSTEFNDSKLEEIVMRTNKVLVVS